VASKIENLEYVCKKIMDVDPTIRFVGVVNDKGKLIEGGPKQGVKPLVDQKESEMVLMEIALMARLRREHDIHLGPVNFTVSHREKVVLLTFPAGNDTIYVSATKEIDLRKVPFNILQILSSDTKQ